MKNDRPAVSDVQTEVSVPAADLILPMGRRNFIVTGVVLGASAGCAGSGVDDSAAKNPAAPIDGQQSTGGSSSVAPSPSPSPSPPPAPEPAPAPPPPVGSLVTTAELSSGEQSNWVPFTFGQLFKKGDIPAGAYATTDLANSQVSVLNRWPDGSAKFAIVSGLADFSGSTQRTLEIASAASAPASRSDVSTSTLRDSGISASIQFGTETVNWGTTDWVNPHRTWLTGPDMSSWLFRKRLGSDAHFGRLA